MVLNLQHDVGGYGAVPGFGAALRIDASSHVRDLVQDVVSAQRHHPSLLASEWPRHGGVPHPVGGVHRMVGISSAGVSRQVGVEAEVPNQGRGGCQSVRNVHKALASERALRTVLMCVPQVADEAQRALLHLPGQLQIVAPDVVVDGHSFSCFRAEGVEVHTVLAGERQGLVD